MSLFESVILTELFNSIVKVICFSIYFLKWNEQIYNQFLISNVSWMFIVSAQTHFNYT